MPGDERETDLITREWSCFGTFPTDRTLFISESGSLQEVTIMNGYDIEPSRCSLLQM